MAPPAKRMVVDLRRERQESSDSGERHTRTEELSVKCKSIWKNDYLDLFVDGNKSEEDSSMFAPLESDIDEESQVSLICKCSS